MSNNMTPLQKSAKAAIEHADEFYALYKRTVTSDCIPLNELRFVAAHKDLLKALGSEIAQPIKPVTMNLSQCTQLLEMFGGCAETEITLLNGNGHSGSGVYAYYDELPEEGAEILT